MSFISEFKKFALRGNVVDLAVGIILGAAFTGVVNSVVKDIIMPPIGLIIGKVDFSNLFIDLSGQHHTSVAEAKAGTAQSLQTGVTMILSQLRNVLTEAGLEEIDATGKPFDANFHEAVSQQPTAEVPEGQVVRQLRKGYKLRDRLLRPATVVVAKKPAA